MTQITETIFSLAMPYCENLDIRRTVYKGGDGPRVAVTAGIHGDELEGLYVCHRLAAWLDNLQRTNPDALRGQVELYPALNPLGLDTLTRSVPVFDSDLNRSFPGSQQGDLPKRLAAAAMSALEGTSLVVDIHASNIYLREIPQVRINSEFSDILVPLAQQANLDLIWIHGAATVLEATVAHSLNSRNIPCLVVEMGVGMRLTPDYCEQLTIGLLHLWQGLGVLASGVVLPELTHHPLVADDSNVHYLNAQTSGMFVPTASHWTDLRRGELLGRIVSPFHGDILSEVRSPVDGLLFTLREYPLVYEGSLMARIMARKRGA
ncbi:MAG: M14 family metallopeptidase [Trichlorobacter sp.]|uniref:M14 family metallopeptidase n=1 Tax=Trichlorobacter sp. TaxID=2911007 RepID=UPI00256B713A|nr:M14 family metallopeptidase [Trichlorobacter sp.]MDK9717373.1 M14 family metallopeptidase [Trichlorobacter sp.]